MNIVYTRSTFFQVINLRDFIRLLNRRLAYKILEKWFIVARSPGFPCTREIKGRNDRSEQRWPSHHENVSWIRYGNWMGNERGNTVNDMRFSSLRLIKRRYFSSQSPLSLPPVSGLTTRKLVIHSALPADTKCSISRVCIQLVYTRRNICIWLAISKSFFLINIPLIYIAKRTNRSEKMKQIRKFIDSFGRSNWNSLWLKGLFVFEQRKR